MHDVNWWLMALAFLLGLLLTLALTIRKVTREVPVARTVTAGIATPHVAKPDLGKVAGAAAVGGAAVAAAKKVEKKAEKVEAKVAEKVAHVEKKVEKVVEKTAQKVERVDIIDADPYGSGSIRVTARKVGPAGYTIKGDKDTGRYFTTDSPDYAEIEAEVWFANEESAVKAGFLRWDAKGDRKVGLVAGAETVVTEDHAAADTTLVIVDDGIPETKTVIVDDGYADADADLVIVEGGPARQSAAVQPVAQGSVGPYGKGSARAGADGSGPAGWLVKGNADSGLYHGPDSPSYEQTIAEVWFVDEATAVAAGFKKWDANVK